MTRRVVVVLLALLVTPAFADPPKLKGTFGFDVMHPKAACAAVSGALLTKLTKDYTCVCRTDPSPGRPGGRFARAARSRRARASTWCSRPPRTAPRNARPSSPTARASKRSGHGGGTHSRV